MDNPQESMFHGSMDLLIRINQTLLHISKARTELDSRKHLILLEDYYSHLTPLLTPEEETKAIQLLKDSNIVVSKIPPGSKTNPEARTILFTFERTLKKFQHNHGLYTKLIEHEDLGSAFLDGN